MALAGFTFHFITIFKSTANVILDGVLYRPPRWLLGVGVDGVKDSTSSPPESPAVDELALLLMGLIPS
jgi:hypothetical protein